MTRADVLEAFDRETIAKTVRTSKTKSCQLQARGPPFIVWHPLWDTCEGWDGASVLSKGRHREAFVRWRGFHSGIVDQLVERRLTEPLWVRLSLCPVWSLPPVQNVQIWCFLWVHPAAFSRTSMMFLFCNMMLPPSSTPPSSSFFSTLADLSRIPQTCLFMCSAKWSDREKHLQPKKENSSLACYQCTGKVVCFVDGAKCCC